MSKPTREIRYANSLIEMSTDMLSKLQQRGAPKQAILRKCTSNAYYAVFHCIAIGGARLLHTSESARVFSARAFKHNQLRLIFQEQLNSGLTSPRKQKKYKRHFSHASLINIVSLSETFVQLQIKRHRADYDFEVKFEKSEVKESIIDAKHAIDLYNNLYENHPEDLKTMTSILLYEKISQAL